MTTACPGTATPRYHDNSLPGAELGKKLPVCYGKDALQLPPQLWISHRMSRKTAWKIKVSDSVRYRQEQALISTSIVLVRSCGPAAFLLRDIRRHQNISFKVCLGDPHTCSCPVFTKKKEPCKHICWILLRVFRVPREHEYSFQHGLVERQVSELLSRSEFTPSTSSVSRCQGARSVCRKAIQDQDVCPICQEELLEIKQPASYCRFGCGNNMHISCMKLWAAYQKPAFTRDVVQCPLCRQDFCSLSLLQKLVKNTEKLFTPAEKEKANVHLGVVCHSCRSCPVTSRCFKCTVCSYFYLCEDCMKKGCHPQHLFASRATRTDKWLVAVQDVICEPEGAACQPEHDSQVPDSSGASALRPPPSLLGASHPPPCAVTGTDSLPPHVLEHLPAVPVTPGSPLLDKGMQCRICLQRFELRQRVRTLPCHHKFHVDCVDQILLESNSCPLDGCVIYSPLTWKTRKTSKSASTVSSGCAKQREKKT
ncbi:E3 ubiquitin-protein ligase ZSWIM2 [Xenentodon cancila]